MIDLTATPRRISATRLLEVFADYGVGSIVDPFMRVPTHLGLLKQHGIAVHGGDLVEWYARVGDGIIANDTTILRDADIGEIVEMLPGRIYPTDLFRAWEGVFFNEEQCVYLGVWHANVRQLRSDGQTGLALLGLWHVLCYWLQKIDQPDTMPDLSPSELAWEYIAGTARWVAPNGKRNTSRCGDARSILASVEADAVFLAPPRGNRSRPDPRIWMWEAWWQGDPYLNLEHYYRDTPFGSRTVDDASYDRALADVLEKAERFPLVVMQAGPSEAPRFERLARASGRSVELRAPAPDEIYVIARL